MYQNYHTDEQFNFQINRFIEPFYENETVQADVYAAAKHITDVKSWISVWMALGQKANDAKQYALSPAYYQLADFFLSAKMIQLKHKLTHCLSQIIINPLINLKLSLTKYLINMVKYQLQLSVRWVLQKLWSFTVALILTWRN